MPCLLDTSIAIPMRDGDLAVIDRVAPLLGAISIVTQVELEGGVYKFPHLTQKRRVALDTLMEGIVVLPFAQEELRSYRSIVARIGYSRRKVIDRMIAATALVYDLTLVTFNGDDFRDVPGLRLEVWPAPAP